MHITKTRRKIMSQCEVPPEDDDDDETVRVSKISGYDS